MTRHDDPGVLMPSAPAPDLTPHIPALAQVAQVDGRVLANVDSSDLTPADWATLARTIADSQADFDGFVVLHGTDTMAALVCIKRYYNGAQVPVPVLAGTGRCNLQSRWQNVAGCPRRGAGCSAGRTTTPTSRTQAWWSRCCSTQWRS